MLSDTLRRAMIDTVGLEERLRAHIRDVAGFPKQGIVFKDIGPLLRDPAALHDAIDGLAAAHRGESIDLVAGIESRGFVLGAGVAYLLGAGFVPVRKAGRLPGPTVSVPYQLEYGEAVLEVQSDAIRAGQRVLVVDDLLATGGTLAATLSLIERLGGEVAGIELLIELTALGGAAALAGRPYHAILSL
jgi:adenine phosphoribosyltransferase